MVKMQILCARQAFARLPLPVIGFGTASIILMAEPVRWLVTTWFDPSYQSSGAIFGVAVLGLLIWSLTSPVQTSDGRYHSFAIALLIFATTMRLVSQLFAINVLGGIALAADIYAILTLLNLSRRKRALSPFWVSVLFLFTLPVERIVQRLMGYPMQEVSAFGACNLLDIFHSDVVCEGIRIQLAGKDVLVDLPCSGTASLMLCLAVVVCLNAVSSTRFSTACFWVILTIAFAITGNAIRISLLALGLVYQDWSGIDVMAQPYHDIIGLCTMKLSLAPIFWLNGKAPAHSRSANISTPRAKLANPSIRLSLASLFFIPLALIIINLPRHAVDVSRSTPQIYLPIVLGQYTAIQNQLEPIEKAYFEQFGGQAKRALYGPMALTVVQTTSPLRHLHSPQDCLRGLGYSIEFLGTQFAGAPTAIYRATGQNGQQWHVAVSYKSDHGHVTSNVAEAIWHWLANPKTTWSSIQRITPWQMNDAARKELETAAIASFDLPANPMLLANATELSHSSPLTKDTQ